MSRKREHWPDYQTWVREEARKQRRMELIRRHQESEGNKVDFRTHSRKILDQTRQQVKEVLNDPRWAQTPRAQNDEAMRLAREGQQAHLEAVREAQEAYDAEVERLERLANPPPQRGQRSTAEMMERRELLDMNLPRWERSEGQGVLEEYRRALKNGDQTMAELIEDFAGQYIKNSAMRQEFGDLVYEQQRSRLPASTKNVVEQLEGLVADEYKIKGGMEHQKHLMSGVVENVKNGRPVVTRDDIAGMQAAGGVPREAVKAR